MADSNTTQPKNDDVSKKKALSPWDEELPAEEPKKNLVVGSLDSANTKDINIDQDKKPVPFNIPANINEEKIGKKIPAEEIIKKQPEVSSSPPPNSMPPVAKPKPPLISTMKPKPEVNKPSGQPPAQVLTPANKDNLQPKPDQIPVEPLQPSPVIQSKSEPIQTPPVQVKPEPAQASLIQAKPESGVSELVQPAGSVAEAEPSEAVKPKPLPVKAQPPVQEKATALPMSPFNREKIEPKSKEEPKPVLPDITPRENQLNAEKRLDSISNIKAQPKPAEVKPEKPDIFAPEKAKIPKVEEKKKEHPPAPIEKPVGPDRPSFFKRPGFIIVMSILFLLTAGIYLTEMGLISVGLENVYGIFGLESLWGGLPRNAEKALGKSAVAMKDRLNFKMKGSVTLTVNKTIKSPITTPLVSIAATPYALRDENIAEGIKGILTQYDYYNSSSSTTDSSTSSSSSSSSSAPSVSSSTTDSSTSYGSQQDAASYQPEESTIKQVDAEFEGESSEDAVKSEIKIKKLVGSDSTLSIVGNKKDLYVKSSPDIKYASNADSSKWLDFNISNVTENNPVKDFTNIKMDKGFSIIGRRSGNEKIGSTRCFKYTLDNLEIGDSLDYLGIKSDSVSKISGDVWIGIVDHYIHKVDVKITPSIASSISQISVTFEMYDYGVENSIVVPALSDKITPALGESATTVPATIVEEGDIYSRDKTRKSDLITIKAALEKYKQTNGSYPKASVMVKLNIKDNIVQTSLIPEFIASIPADPKAAEGWYYGYKSDGNKFTLSARLENSADAQVTKVGDAYIHWVYNN